MSDLQNSINDIISDDVDYFYHITSSDGESILENGLIVANPRWSESFLKFTEEELNNIDKLIQDNRSNLKDNYTIIIVGVYKDMQGHFIRKLSEDERYDIMFEGVGNPDYIVESRFILGYINMDSEELHINYESDVVDILNL